MTPLQPNWITEGHIDFEYKKYMLLAYLQHVGQHFNAQRLYPSLAELVAHYNNLVGLKTKKQQTESQMPKRLTKIDLEQFTLAFEKMAADDEYLEIVEEIVDYALPRIKQELDNGKSIYDYVEEQLLIEPIGVVPIDTTFGYFFLYKSESQKTKLYEYALSIYSHAKEQYRSLKTVWKADYEKSKVTTFESLKLRVVKDLSLTYLPATYLVHSKMPFPLKETLLPVAKRSFVRYLAETA